jgi:hypothetical protein
VELDEVVVTGWLEEELLELVLDELDVGGSEDELDEGAESAELDEDAAEPSELDDDGLDELDEDAGSAELDDGAEPAELDEDGAEPAELDEDGAEPAELDEDGAEPSELDDAAEPSVLVLVLDGLAGDGDTMTVLVMMTVEEAAADEAEEEADGGSVELGEDAAAELDEDTGLEHDPNCAWQPLADRQKESPLPHHCEDTLALRPLGKGKGEVTHPVFRAAVSKSRTLADIRIGSAA